ncbi:MAG: MFS transporter [Deltaproteobacteria bacterium]|nr:MFS transporter [Deltaproteobacteria bacterium]
MRRTGPAALAGSCAAIFWPGAFIFGLPGVMAQHWQTSFHIGRGAVGRTLFFVLAAVGIFMFLTGRWQEKAGARRLVALGVVLCGASTLLLGRAPGIGFVYLWAFAVGVSSSLIYIPSLTVVQQWFPRRRGLASGLVNLAFGFSAAVMSPLFSRMILHLGASNTTLLLGAGALIFGLAAVPLVNPPDPACTPPRATAAKPPPALGPSLSVSQSLRTRAFWLLWLTWALAGAAGISMVTLSTSFGLAGGLPVHEAVLILTAFNMTNGLSRLLSGFLSDFFGRNATMAVTFLAAGCAYLLFGHVQGLVPWSVLATVVGFAFGTLFAVSAPLAGDCFGMKHFGAIFGLVFTAYGFVAGVVGPWLSGYVLDVTRGDFTLVFNYLGAFCLASAVLIWFARPGSVKPPQGGSPHPTPG